MTIAVTVGACFSIDLAYECYLVLIKTSPTSYLRMLVSQNQTIEEKENKQTFDQISEKVQDQMRRKSTNRRKVTDHR